MMASASNCPPPPNTNQRLFHDVSVIANIPPDDQKLKTFRIALIAAETWKRKDLMSGGAVFGPEGIEVFARGKKALELDELDRKVVQKEMQKWVEKNLDEEKKKAVEEAGIFNTTRASRKKAVLVVGKGNGGAGASRGKSNASASAEPGMSREGRGDCGDTENTNTINDEQQQLQKEDGDVTYTWSCDEIRHKIRTCLFPSSPSMSRFPQKMINRLTLTFPIHKQFSKIAEWRPPPSNVPSTHPQAHSYVS